MEGLSFDFGLRGLLFLAGEAGGTSRTKQSGQHSSEQQAGAVQRPEQQQQKGERTTVAAEQCTHCGSLQPGPPGGTYWRQHPTSKEQLCGQCYGRASRYGGELPALSDAEAEQEESEEEQPQQQPLQRQCLQCGSTSKGTKSAQWHRHPATGEEWLCQPCYQKVDSALKRQHRQAETQAQQEEKSEVELEGEEQPQQQPLQRQCLQCGSTAKGSAKWARWRRHPTTGEGWLCQPCFNDVQAAFRRQKWQAEMHPWQEVESEVEPKEEEHPQQQPLQRQCFQCGSTTKGSAKWATWRRHPITGEEWLCQPCFNDVQAPLRRQRRQAEKQRRQEVEREVGPEEDHSEEEAAIAAAVKQCTHCGSLRPGPAGATPAGMAAICQRCRMRSWRGGRRRARMKRSQLLHLNRQQLPHPPPGSAPTAAHCSLGGPAHRTPGGGTPPPASSCAGPAAAMLTSMAASCQRCPTQHCSGWPGGLRSGQQLRPSSHRTSSWASERSNASRPPQWMRSRLCHLLGDPSSAASVTTRASCQACRCNQPSHQTCQCRRSLNRSRCRRSRIRWSHSRLLRASLPTCSELPGSRLLPLRASHPSCWQASGRWWTRRGPHSRLIARWVGSARPPPGAAVA